MSWLIFSALVASQRRVLTLLENDVMQDCLLSVSAIFSLCLMHKWLIIKLIVL
uniref:Uncharacterized protein n=1 Tax=Anguilla anguilla TaxID=7936 RepID=A0A0E9VBD8_ANGAN